MNPLFQMMGGGGLPGMPFGNPQNLKQQFSQWRQTMSGDPNQILQQWLQSGRCTQDQVNRATQMAQMFGQFLR